MSSKSKRDPAAKTRAASLQAPRTAPSAVPEIGAAQNELARRYLRAVVWLFIRVVALGLLSALLAAQIPFLAAQRYLLDMGSGILVLWPFFTGVGRIYAYRITLGQRYIESGQFAEAETILAPVNGWRARYFDITGEGLFLRATAARALHHADEAITLLAQVERRGGVWGEKAQAERTNVMEAKS